jgi:hypothetical protein
MPELTAVIDYRVFPEACHAWPAAAREFGLRRAAMFASPAEGRSLATRFTAASAALVRLDAAGDAA